MKKLLQFIGTVTLKSKLGFAALLCMQFSTLLISCTQDTYEKGDGYYSLMRGDFVEAAVGADKTIVSLTTDEGETLPMAKPYAAKWITRPDTVYRCMLYYNKVRDDKGQYVAEPISVGEVPCPKIYPLPELKTSMKTDPVKFESAWMSKTGKYLNLSFCLMTGTKEDDAAIHTLSIVQDSIVENVDGTRTSYLCLFHDQAGVPEYYSTQVYVSINTSQILADSVAIAINTYKGIATRTFLLKK